VKRSRSINDECWPGFSRCWQIAGLLQPASCCWWGCTTEWRCSSTDDCTACGRGCEI